MFFILVWLFFISLSKCNSINFVRIIGNNEHNLEIYHTQIHPIFSKYPSVTSPGENYDIDVKNFLFASQPEEIVTVLIELNKILPKHLQEMKKFELGFFTFIFQYKPLYISELLIIRNEIELLKRLLAKNPETAFTFAQNIVKLQPPIQSTEKLLNALLDIYPFAFERITSIKYGMFYFSYLLHEACSSGNIPAILSLLKHGSDPKLCAGNPENGIRRTALYYAAADTTGMDSFRIILHSAHWDEIERNSVAKSVSNNNLINDEMKMKKIYLLTRKHK